ncbi:hypothetical protein CI594_08400 [Fischerella thermalis CCMEE 5196]|nr:hypothetical protein CI594_08400 [Fischerella thermalis CCMEE 5196]
MNLSTSSQKSNYRGTEIAEEYNFELFYFFVHCPLEERSPNTARHFQKLLEQNGVKVPPLPWDNLDSPPNQLNLW